MKQKQLTIFIGKPRHGKDTLANFAAEVLGGTVGACSDAIYHDYAQTIEQDRREAVSAARIPREERKARRPDYSSAIPPSVVLPDALDTAGLVRALKAIPKEVFRPYLIARGDMLCWRNPTALIEWNVEQGVNFLTGVRRWKELEAAKSKLVREGVDVRSIWVERVGFDGPADNTELTREAADAVVEVQDGAFADGVALGPYLWRKHLKQARNVLNNENFLSIT